MVISGKEEIAKIYRSGNLGEWDMTKKGGKSLWQGIIDFSSAHRTMMISGAKVLCWIAIVVQLVCVWSLWYVVLPVAMVPSFAYFASNFLITDKDEKKKAVKAYYGSWVSSVTAAVNSLLIIIVPTFLVFDKVVDLRRIVCIIADILLLVSLGYMIRRPLMKVRLAKMIEWNLPVKLGYKGSNADVKAGDIALCRDRATSQNVVIPRKDRFLHMLALGPTGSGKTSQIILPMLNQDMQNEKAGITVIEPKGDLAEKAYAMAQYYGRKAIYFNPVLKGCPTFNPLYGKEEDVIENMVTTFKMLDPDSAQYFQDLNEQLLRNAIKVLKRTYGNDATMIKLSRLLANPQGEGKKMIVEFSKVAAPESALGAENEDIANYFLSDYFGQQKSKVFENTSGLRSQVAKIVSNKFLRKVLNPSGESAINLDNHLEDGTVLCISTAQGKLRDLGKYLGYFIILSFQSSTFKRPGNENTRRDHFLYIDEFQSYANPGFADMLTQGRSYRVASHLATQNRALMGMGSGKDGEDFIELVSTNARNIVIFPGGNYFDAKYYSDQFGEVEKVKIGESTAVSAGTPLSAQGRQPAKDTFQIKEEFEARMSPTDIILREFGEITYSIVKNNTLQPAGVGRVEYIDKGLNEILDQMVVENNKLMSLGLDPNKYRDFNDRGRLKDGLLNWDLINKDCAAIAEEEKRAAHANEPKTEYKLTRYDVGGDPNVWPLEEEEEERRRRESEGYSHNQQERRADDSSNIVFTASSAKGSQKEILSETDDSENDDPKPLKISENQAIAKRAPAKSDTDSVVIPKDEEDNLLN